MRVGLALHGNLRTFLMPGPEGKRLCDALMDNIVGPSGADVFAFTDSNDFFHDGVQYFVGGQIDVLHDDPSRLCDKIVLLDDESGRRMVKEQVERAIGASLKALVVESPYDASSDPMFKALYDADLKGGSPVRLVHQWRKVKLASELVPPGYDVTIKWRFDLNCSGKLDVNSYDFSSTDVYVPCVTPPLVTDWFAFGTRPAMQCYSDLYDNLGAAIGDPSAPAEYALASEYVLFRMFKERGIRARHANYDGYPYRYRGYSYGKTTKELENDIVAQIDGMGLDATVVSHSSSARDPKILRRPHERP